jgi:transcriptional regulator with XRE-family HTH domain
MIATNEIKGLIRARGMTQAEVAEKMGINPVTLSRKLGKGILNSDEIEVLIDILEIKNPASIFFGH